MSKDFYEGDMKTWNGFDVSHIDFENGEGKTFCPKCRSEGKDKHGDNLYVYSNFGGANCFGSGASGSGCGFNIPSRDTLEQSKENSRKPKAVLSEKDIKKLFEKRLSEASYKKVVDEETSPKLMSPYRGLDPAVCERLNIRWVYDEVDGKVSEMWFPATIIEDGEVKVTGYKIRKRPKDFRSMGYVGKVNTFGGQTNAIAETLMIVGGEIDLVSAEQMLEPVRKYNKSVNVVTPLLGEGSVHDCIQANFEYVNKHKKIILCLDNDDAGKSAIEECLKILPRDKVFIANLRHKDPNKYIESGDQDKFAQDAYWNVNPAENFGIIHSGALFQYALESTEEEDGIDLPPYMMDLKGMIPIIPKSSIVLFAGQTSSGKTTFMEEFKDAIIIDSRKKTAIFSFEDNAKQYGLKIASRAIGVKLARLPKSEQRRLMLDNQDKVEKLLYDEEGNHRFVFIEEGFSTLNQAKNVILHSIKVLNCEVVVIDPLQNLIGSKSNEEQRDFMLFLEECKRLYGTIFLLGVHIRKVGNGEKSASEGAFFSEDDIEGSGAIAKSATITFAIFRDKNADTERERNSTIIGVLKNRPFGETAQIACKVFYRKHAHRLYPYSVAMRHGFFKDDVEGQIIKDLDLGYHFVDEDQHEDEQPKDQFSALRPKQEVGGDGF